MCIYDSKSRDSQLTGLAVCLGERGGCNRCSGGEFVANSGQRGRQGEGKKESGGRRVEGKWSVVVERGGV